MKRVFVVLLSAFFLTAACFGQSWTKSIRAKANHPNRNTSIEIARRRVMDKMRVEEAVCLGSQGKFDVQYVLEHCWKTQPAPGFPDEYVCTVRGDASCILESFAVGDVVRVLKPTALYSGSEVVGQIAEGSLYKVRAIEGDWIALETLKGVPVKGWASSKALEKHTAPSK